MNNSNQKKTGQLGMPIGTASAKLRKQLLFGLVQETGRDVCFQCGEKIEEIENFSIEHKVPYLDSEDPVGLFFDPNNIAFSHLKCNARAGRKPPLAGHGSFKRYSKHGCRCVPCTEANRDNKRRWREKSGRN